MRLDASAWDKWESWCSLIERDLRSVVDDARVYRTVATICQANEAWIDEHYGGYFFRFVHRNYSIAAITAVRRHVSGKGNEASLLHPMDQIHKTAAQLTFESYLEHFPDNGAPWQAGAFSKLSDDGRVVSGDLVKRDMGELRRLGEACKRIADREIAHLDERGPAGVVLPMTELAAAVEGIGELACKYLLFTTGTGWHNLESTVVFPWTRIFSVPMNKAKISLRDC